VTDLRWFRETVPPLRDFLSRFRPAGAPGAAARAPVPVDHARELEAEVGPVLALLDDARDECDQILQQARRDAGAVMAAARAEAAAIAAAGDQRAQMARDEAARRLCDAAAADTAAMVAEARQQAGRIRTLAGQRMPALVSAAMGELRRMLLAADLMTGTR
jgi:vacuolar-type H+-ATPase subunit H